jgi:hypothetical protein
VKILAVTLLIAFSAPASADVPNGVAERVSHFILDGCDYLEKNSPQPFKPEPAHKRLAAHFGHIVKSQKRGIGIEYLLKVPAYDGWELAYWERGVDMKPPPTVAITMGDLQHWLGRDEAPDVDYAMSATSGGSEREFAEREFQPPGHGVCRVSVQTEVDAKKGPARRVFSLRFWN